MLQYSVLPSHQNGLSTGKRMDPPEPKDFSLCALKIEEKCAYRKVLSPGLYYFNDKLIFDNSGGCTINPSPTLISDFFAPNISIHAIVGENGSGKSSLLELLYRLVNNFSFMLEIGMHKSGAAMKLCYIEGLHMTLFYVIDGKLGLLSVNDDDMYFHYDSCEYSLYFERFINDKSENVKIETLDIKDEVVKEATVTAPVARMAEIARSFFYTIVTNYSAQSFIDEDYREESSLVEYRQRLVDEKGGKKHISRRVIKRDDGDVWITHIFHKNDGYRTPIVLNPFRDEGRLDMLREYRLSTYRLSLLFLKAKSLNTNIISGYKFRTINYAYDTLAIERKYENLFYRQHNHNKEWIELQNIPDGILKKPNSFAYIILEQLGLLDLDFSDVLTRDSCLYMVYKVFAIAAKYPTYYEYEDFFRINTYFQEVDKERTKERLQALVEQIKKDKSHVTVKFRQMDVFIRLLKIFPNKISLRKINIDHYFGLLVDNKIIENIPNNTHKLLEILPPALFTIDIFVSPEGQNDNLINIRTLSSGQRQFLYTCSTFVYHILNLKSIQGNNRVRYRCMNLVLDEVEICFHPEYQCSFISKLIELLTKLRLNYKCSINIILATHSPFILSDIPKQHILYLEEGQAVNDKITVNPYAANVNDILHQSFFLKDSFMGEFAIKKIRELVQKIESISISSKIDIGEIEREIQIIGDDFLKQQLSSLLTFKTALHKQ